MKGFKSKKGISLIVLVITIIVMIILAAAIILSLNNSGIIDKANKAKQDSDTANLKEYVNILQAEYELMTETERAGKTSIEYVNSKLAEKGYTQAYLADDGTLYTNLQSNTKAALESGIKIGDTVTGYTLDTSADKKTYTTSGKENTAPSGGDNVTQVDTPQTVTRTEYTTWKYIGISENGELLIAPDMGSITSAQYIKLSGKGGFVNGPAELNNMCKALYSTNKGTARSMNIEDINRILEYTPPVSTKLIASEITGVATPEADKDIEDYYEDNYVISKTNPDILKSLNTGKDEDIERKNLLLNFVFINDYYWLASSCVGSNGIDYRAYFWIRLVSNLDNVAYWFLFDSNNTSYSISYAYRPVVHLYSNIQLTKVSEGNWSI